MPVDRRFFGFGKNVFVTGLVSFFMDISSEMIYPQKAFLATIIPQDFKATAFGVFNTVVGLAMFPASLIGGYLWDNVSPNATFYFGAVTAGISAVLFIVFILVADGKQNFKRA
ncbi:MAG: hypothetical protein HY758_11175 [Nitrospirae bacterium]|nr:hypothetical protein [Nitrospirota bacterium]